MPRVMKWMAAISTGASALLLVLFSGGGSRLLLTAGITCGTIAYHFCMRLLVGWGYDRAMGNRADYYHPWFRQYSFDIILFCACSPFFPVHEMENNSIAPTPQTHKTLHRSCSFP